MTGVVRFWNYLTQQCLYTINENRPSQQTLGVAVNCNETNLVTFGADCHVYVYDIATKARIINLTHRSS